MSKRVVFWVIVLLSAGGAFAWWSRRRSGAAESAIAYRTATVQRGDVTQTVAASGTLSAITTVEVGSQVSGQIAKLHADFNSVVKANQLLAEIEPSTYETRVLQADADLSSARATLEMKQLSLKRARELSEKQLLSQADFDQTQTEVRQQESAVRVKEAALKSAQVDLERTKIRSPIDGVVISRDINLGQTVQASFSAPKLFVIAKDLREMQITASVSEADIGGVDPGQEVTFTVDAFAGRTFNGKVREVRNNPTTVSNVVNYATIIDVGNPDLKLRPGMTANVTITIARRRGVLRLPNSALRFHPPEGAVVTNAAAVGSGGKAAPAESSDEGPNLAQLPPEIRDRILANFDKNKDGQLDADERKAMREQMQGRKGPGGGGGGFGGGMAMRGPGGGGGPGGAGGEPPFGGGAPRVVRTAAPGTPQTRTIYVVGAKPDASGRATGPLTAVTVLTGLSDSTNTEILSGVDEGAVVASGTSTTAPATASQNPTNPFVPRPPAMKSR